MWSSVPVPLRRAAYRLAYRLLQLNWLLRHPQTLGVKCLLTDGDRVLLVRHSYGPRRWDIPGGGLHRGETPEHSIRREIEEELGLRDLALRRLGSVRALADHRLDTLHCFSAEVTAPTIRTDPGEIATARWFPAAQLPSPRAEHVDLIVRLALEQREDA